MHRSGSVVVRPGPDGHGAAHVILPGATANGSIASHVCEPARDQRAVRRLDRRRTPDSSHDHGDDS